jgi:hypothetical protein
LEEAHAAAVRAVVPGVDRSGMKVCPWWSGARTPKDRVARAIDTAHAAGTEWREDLEAIEARGGIEGQFGRDRAEDGQLLDIFQERSPLPLRTPAAPSS